MAEPTGLHVLTAAHYSLAITALCEISTISIALRSIIAVGGDERELEELSRGMLARIDQLSNAVVDCVDSEPPPLPELFTTIECMPPTASWQASVREELAADALRLAAKGIHHA